MRRCRSGRLTQAQIELAENEREALNDALVRLAARLPEQPEVRLTYFSARIYFSKGWLATLYPTILFFVFAILTDILCGMLLQSGGIPAGELMGSGTARLIYNILCKLFHLLCLYIILTSQRQKLHI